jgi:hypothetical protein
MSMSLNIIRLDTSGLRFLFDDKLLEFLTALSSPTYELLG